MPLIDELRACADQLERNAANARMGNADVRVTDPAYLVELLRRAASVAEEARRPV